MNKKTSQAAQNNQNNSGATASKNLWKERYGEDNSFSVVKENTAFSKERFPLHDGTVFTGKPSPPLEWGGIFQCRNIPPVVQPSPSGNRNALMMAILNAARAKSQQKAFPEIPHNILRSPINH